MIGTGHLTGDTLSYRRCVQAVPKTASLDLSNEAEEASRTPKWITFSNISYRDDRMPAVKRVLLPDTNQSPKHLLTALGIADQLCRTTKTLDVIFLTPNKAALDSGSIRTAVGDPAHKAFMKGTPVKLESGALVRCETKTTLKWVSQPAVVVVAFASQDMMDKVDALPNVVAIVAVPWTTGAIDDWVKTWSPEIHGKPATPVEVDSLINDPIVEQAMKSLSTIVNKAHNILHPSDEEHAKRILRILRARNHQEPAENVRRWAIRNGWLPKAAERLETLAEKAFSLRTKPKIDNPDHAEQLYQRWSSAAK